MWQKGIWNAKTSWMPQMRLCENLEILICHLVTVWEALGKTCAACALQDNFFGINNNRVAACMICCSWNLTEKSTTKFLPMQDTGSCWLTTKQLRCPCPSSLAQQLPSGSDQSQWAKQPVLPFTCLRHLGCDRAFAAFWDTDEERVIEKTEQAKINWQGSTMKEGKDRKAWSSLF